MFFLLSFGSWFDLNNSRECALDDSFLYLFFPFCLSCHTFWLIWFPTLKILASLNLTWVKCVIIFPALLVQIESLFPAGMSKTMQEVSRYLLNPDTISLQAHSTRSSLYETLVWLCVNVHQNACLMAQVQRQDRHACTG